jgi:hypothetical protein
VSSLVAKSDWTTLSRWRHGFKSRWDYKPKRAGQGPSLRAKPGLEHATCWPLIPRISRDSSRICIDVVARDARPCLSLHVSSRPTDWMHLRSHVSTCTGGDTRPQSLILGRWIGLSFVGDLVGALQATGRPRRAPRQRRQPTDHEFDFALLN